jgi:hypothetical protein
MSIAKRVAVYYAKAVLFAAMSYGVLMLLYDTAKLSFLEWLLVVFVASTIGLVPYLCQVIREEIRKK